MASDMIDNRHERLVDCVGGLLRDGAVAAHLAVGYLFLDGLVPLQAEIARLDDVQILIGNVVNRLTEEQIREQADARLAEGMPTVRDQEDIASALRGTHARIAALTALSLRRTLDEMPRDAESRSLLLTLAARIAAGALKVRLYTQGRVHAKSALLSYPDGRRVAIVGSSNLTLGGPAHPTEMNVVVRDVGSVEDLAGWYRSLWETAQDFHRELFEELGQCWAARP